MSRSPLLALLLVACASAPPDRPASVPGDPDAIVVLGNRPPRDAHGIAHETRARVEHGVALLRAGRAPRILFSGGASTPQWVEADVMAEHAEGQGVDARAILRERASRDTIENARMSVALLRARVGERRPRVLLVTSDYHSERAARLFRCAGADVVASPVKLVLDASARAAKRRSERLARIYYLLIDECKRASG